MRRTSLFLTVEPTSGRFVTSLNGGKTWRINEKATISWGPGVWQWYWAMGQPHLDHLVQSTALFPVTWLSQCLQYFWCRANFISESTSSFSFLRGMAVHTSTRKAEQGENELKVCFSYIAGLPPNPKGGEGQWSSFCEHKDPSSVLRNQGKVQRWWHGLVILARVSGDRRILGACWQASLAKPESFRTVTEEWGRKKVDGVQESTSHTHLPSAPAPRVSHSSTYFFCSSNHTDLTLSSLAA